MKTTIFAATFSARTPGKTKGVSARPRKIATSSSASQRLRGRSPESRCLSMAARPPSQQRTPTSVAGAAWLSVGHGIESLRAPEQDRDHEADVREHRHRRREKAGVVRHQADQQRADEAARRRAEAADDDDDEDEHVDRSEERRVGKESRS